MEKKLQTALFGGGCFWCMVPPFEELEGVITVLSGYSGGDEENPSYEDVSRGLTGHFEVVQITYDPAVISYSQLLDIFWKNIDPTDDGGQFVDRGNHYRPVIFYQTEEEREIAEKSKKALDDSRIFTYPIVTQILPAKAFWQAEEYHQNYHKKRAQHYNFYKMGSGRAGFLTKMWQKEKSGK